MRAVSASLHKDTKRASRFTSGRPFCFWPSWNAGIPAGAAALVGAQSAAPPSLPSEPSPSAFSLPSLTTSDKDLARVEKYLDILWTVSRHSFPRRVRRGELCREARHLSFSISCLVRLMNDLNI